MKPKILLFDIETMANLAYVWGKYEQDVVAYQKEWYIISFSAKWLHGGQITKALPDYRLFKKKRDSDKSIVKHLWELFNEADILVAHNGNSFDIKKCNARFAFYGLPPPAPYKTVDTKLVAKRYGNFNSNSLNDLGKTLGLGKKVETGGFDLWLDCIVHNKPHAWELMKRYNAQDVRLLEKIYLHFLPWMQGHPNMGMWNGEVCPKCGSRAMTKQGTRRLTTGLYQQYQCQKCGGWALSHKPLDKISTLKSI